MDDRLPTRSEWLEQERDKLRQQCNRLQENMQHYQLLLKYERRKTERLLRAFERAGVTRTGKRILRSAAS